MHSQTPVHCNEKHLFAFKQLNQADKKLIKMLEVWRVSVSWVLTRTRAQIHTPAD